VVVTGGAGFIGSHLVDALLAAQTDVLVLDDLSGGNVENLPRRHPRLRFEPIVVGRSAQADLDCKVATCDLVVHLAGPIGVHRVTQAPGATVETIVDAGIALADSCRRHRKPVLFSSSSEVYGQTGTRPVVETDPVALGSSPRWSYAAAKFAVEHVIGGLSLTHGLQTRIVRLFNVVGARQRPETGLVLATFCSAAQHGRPLVVHGDGSSRRAFLHVRDAVTGLLAISGSNELNGRPVNLGGLETMSISDLAHLVLRRWGRGGDIRFVDPADAFGPRFDPVSERTPDLSLLRSATDWSPRLSVTDAVDDCLSYLLVSARGRAPQ
jgi:UDP-glucose 4-epimerase